MVIGMAVGVTGGLVSGGPGAAAFVLVGVLVLATVGLLDDLRGLLPAPRLAAMLLIGAVIGAGVQYHIDDTAAANGRVAIAAIVGAVWYASVVNATNFMDGINGISGSVGFVAGMTYGLAGLTLGHMQLAILGFSVAGAALGFLPFNLPTARVFLGDVGSYGLGAAMAGASLLAFSVGVPVELCVSPLALYLADTGTTLVRRLRTGEAVLQAHRSHIYQRLTDLLGSHTMVSVLAAGVSALVVASTSAALSDSAALRWAANAVAVLLLTGYVLSPRLISFLVSPRLIKKGAR